MDNCRINIAVIEPSDIVYEGLSNMLLKSDRKYFLYRLGNMDDPLLRSGEIDFRLAIVNPVAIQNKTSEFQKFNRKGRPVPVLGIVYSFFDPSLLNLFDDTFSVNDPAVLIGHKLSILLKSSECKKIAGGYLSEREKEILVLLVQGLSHKEIAEQINISVHTVTSHRKNIIEKTGIKSLSGLTIYAITKKILPLDSISPELLH
jgi:DNA-binding CsgD family transcriptional regulator